MKVLLVLGHPRKDSFCGALAAAYRKGAQTSGAEIRFLPLSDLIFDLNVTFPEPQHQEQEADLQKAQQDILWADHLVFVYPIWWGMMPALLKGFLDRVFVPGFAFYEKAEGDYQQLLSRKTAQLIITMDTPVWIYRTFIKAPGTQAMKVATLQFCGISPVRMLHFSPVKHSTAEEKEKWLQRTYNCGAALNEGIITSKEMLWRKMLPWVKAIRLQFYPMTWVAYAVGALAARQIGYDFSWLTFWLGYLLIFLIELATVYLNEIFDYQTDAINKAYGPFNGGSRVLVNGEIGMKKMKNVVRLVMLTIPVVFVLLNFSSPAAIGHNILLCTVLVILAFGYTVPPLKLSYRSLGEITVGLTHSLLVILCGFIFQGGNYTESFPWLVSIPLFFSIIPSITLSGIPDHEADQLADKHSLSVRFGKNKAAFVSIVCTVLALISSLYLYFNSLVPGVYNSILLLPVFHGAWLIFALVKYINVVQKPRQINELMILSLTYLMWFALIPFFELL